MSAPYHWQATDRQGLLVLQLAVAAHGEGGPSVAGHGGEHDQRREPVAFDAGAAWAAGWGWRELVQGGVAAEPRGHGDLGGQPLERLADVGGVADQVHRPAVDVGDDQVQQLAGQLQRGVVGVAGEPQPRQDGQAHRPVQEREMDDDADHDPAVAPGGAVAAGAVAVVVPGRAVQLWAAAVPEGVVDRQHDRRAGGDQHRGDEVQQDQAELVSRPACGGEEAVAKVVVAATGQPCPSQHPGDGPLARPGQEPAHQCLEGPHRRLGEAGAERDEQVGERAR